MSQKLMEIIKAKSFRKGKFTLASGQTSEYFFDLKPTMMDQTGIGLIADALFEKLWLLRFEVQAVGGMATGGIPLVTAALYRTLYANTYIPLSGFFVRAVQKDHGTERKIEGILQPGTTAVMVEDVTTTGGSIMEAVKAVRAIGCTVNHVITVIDRLEGAADNLRQEGLTLHPIFVRTDFD